MDRYRYFIFNQKSMVVLGILQIACAGVCIVSGFIDTTFRKVTVLRNTRAPIWAGAVMSIPGALALFSSQKKNSYLVNFLIASSVLSCFTTIIVVVYAILTLGFGEDDDDVFHSPYWVMPHEHHYILGKMVEGANIVILLASFCSLSLDLIIAYIGCRSLPNCTCYDSVNGMASLVPTEEQHSQSIELVSTFQGEDEKTVNAPVPFVNHELSGEEEEIAKPPPPYIRFI
ncbi:uncharacterized protein LOC122793510 [Protopterus annectens]|uniref:uncharacterized protein LOC122793510 n=1 Tax=Protopterus annectens TaxID=7888 RepID=UPI001CF96514|nr:uncharacterized protein LOC122793510 [Protopterus annectens]